MPVYKAPVDDTLFLLNDVFNIERYNNLPGFADAPPDMLEAILGLGADDIDLVKNAIDKKLLPIDLVLFAKESVTNAAIDAAYGVARAYRSDEVGTARKMLAARPDLDRRYVNRVRLGGVKFWLDGSIPTGWMSQPYASPPPGAPADYRAYGQIDDKTLAEAFDRFWTSPMQINMHMMGDAAAEQALRAIEAAIRKHGRSDHRPVFVHATYMRLDQIERMRAVGGVPSYLCMALVGGGDTALKLWGADRANHAMAASTAFKKGVRFTLSHDAPVTPQPTILALVDAAVNRTTVNGTVVGAQERLTPYQGLLAVTNHAAWQIKEERAKGSLEPGKLADLVILDRNPLKVDPKAIKTIRVVETIKEGRTVFDARRSAQKLGALGERLMALSGHATHQFSFGPCPGCRSVASGGARAAAATSRFECT